MDSARAGSPRLSSRHEIPIPQALPLGMPESRASNSENLGEDILFELKTFQQKLLEKESLLTTKEHKIASRKANTKGEIKTFFDQLHELMERRKDELNVNVDYGYEDIEFEVEEQIGKLYNIRVPIETMLDACTFRNGTVTNDMLRTLCTETREKVEAIEEEEDVDIPDFIVNLNIKTTVDEMVFGRFSNETKHTDERSQDSNNYAQGDICTAVGSENHHSCVPLSYPDEPDNECDDVDNTRLEHARISDRVQSENSIRSAQCSTSADLDMAIGPEASAPPLVLVGDPEEDPPPYWQAVGLDGPTQQSLSEDVSSLRTTSYTDPSHVYTELDTNPTGTLTNNVLEPLLYFPLRDQSEVKPVYVAMSWDNKRICVADRNNRMLKFFSHDGTLMSQKRITCGEVYNIAYLENDDDEARYVATLPKESALLLVSVFEDNSIKLVKKIAFKKYERTCYTSICRGPSSNTLVGAVTVPEFHATSRKPCVQIFDFNGKVVHTYQRTVDNVELQYPNAVKVHDDLIFVSDWKLNLVAVFHVNGSPTCQYKGTSTCPLVDPLDLDFDCYGNVLVVNGRYQNIHVMSADGKPVEVIKVPESVAVRTQPKLIAFDAPTSRLAMVTNNGEMAVFKFRNIYNMIRP